MVGRRVYNVLCSVKSAASGGRVHTAGVERSPPMHEEWLKQNRNGLSPLQWTLLSTADRKRLIGEYRLRLASSSPGGVADSVLRNTSGCLR